MTIGMDYPAVCGRSRPSFPQNGIYYQTISRDTRPTIGSCSETLRAEL